MGIEKQEMYVVKCDGCGEYYEQNDTHPVFTDKVDADNDVRNYGEWHKECDKYYCTDCYSIDEDTDKIIIKTNRK